MTVHEKRRPKVRANCRVRGPAEGVAGGRARNRRMAARAVGAGRAAVVVVAALAAVATAGCGVSDALIGGKPRSPEETIRVTPGNGTQGCGPTGGSRSGCPTGGWSGSRSGGPGTPVPRSSPAASRRTA